MDRLPESHLRLLSELATELERSKRFEMVFNHVSTPICVLDIEGHVIECNRTAFDLLIDGTDEINGRPIEDVSGFVPETDWSRLFQQAHRGESINTTIDTTETEHHLAIEPVTDVTGKVAYLVLELRPARVSPEPVEHIEDDRFEELTSMLVHELRSPLSLAMGYAELAADEADSNEINRVQTALTRIDQLLDDVVAFASKGSYVEDRTPVDLAEVAQQAWESSQTGGATLRIASTEAIEADRTRLLQVLENLFRNAVKHGGEDVTVTVGVFDDGFYVEDDGPGIPDEHRNEVFDAGVTLAETGSGFGLAIVRKIVEAHGWRIELLESEADGARFEVHTE